MQSIVLQRILSILNDRVFCKLILFKLLFQIHHESTSNIWIHRLEFCSDLTLSAACARFTRSHKLNQLMTTTKKENAWNQLLFEKSHAQKYTNKQILILGRKGAGKRTLIDSLTDMSRTIYPK